jgi:ribosomal protein L11 methyltransferase
MSSTVRLAAAFPEAQRIAEFIERDFADDGTTVSLFDAGETWLVEAYFTDRAPDDVRHAILDKLGADAFCAPLSVEQTPDIDWTALSLSGLHAVRAGRFLVHGSHDHDMPRAGRIAIEIDAGQAFGTGHHETTAGCLMALQDVLNVRRPRNALDIGSGTGVLAIAIAKAARCPVLATDIDPMATAISLENAARNDVAPLVTSIVADGTRHREIRRRAPYDLIVANILAGPLMRLAPDIARLLAPGGQLILSGLLTGQRNRVIAAYGRQRITLDRVRTLGEWCVLTLSRPAG